MKLTKLIAVVSIALFPILASAQYTVLPTPETNDGKFLSVAGNKVSGGLTNQKIVIWFNIPSTAAGFTLSIYDGDQGGSWDITYGGADVTLWKLFADPEKTGSSTTVVDSWTNAEMTDSSWYSRQISVSDVARSPSGNYFYRLEVSYQNPTASNDLNGFKIRTDTGTVSVVPGSSFWFIGSPINAAGDDDGPNQDPPVGYDGIWDFYMWIPAGLTKLEFKEGDADWGPTGAPPDNNTEAPEFAVGDNINFTVYGPDGNIIPLSPPGSQPSRNKQFVTHIVNASDMGLTTFPPGVYRWHWEGVDSHNQTVIIPTFEIYSVPPPPPPPIAGIEITPDNQVEDFPGSTVIMSHTVRNKETYPDVIDIQVVGNTFGWMTTLLKDDGVTPLSDTNSNGIPDVGTVPATGTVNLKLKTTIPLTVNPGTTNTVVLRAISSSTSATDEATDRITAKAYLGIDIRPDNASTVKPGETVTYTHQVENKESFQDVIELSAISNRGWTVVLLDSSENTLADTNGNGTIDTGPMAAAQVKTIKIKILVPQGTPAGTVDTTTVTARSSTTSLSDTATDTTTVKEPDKPNIQATKFVDRTTAKPGELITYTVNYQNIGNATAYNVEFTDLIPQYTEFVSASGSGSSVTYRHTAGGQFDASPQAPVVEVKWSIASIPSGGSGTLTMVVRVK